MNMEKEDIDFFMNKCPVGLFVFNRRLDIDFSNKQASVFLLRYELPKEVYAISRRIFEAISLGRLEELFPGEIFFSKRFNGSPSNWIFKLYINEKSDPLVYLLITEEKMSNKINMNDIRRQFKLTRRETDILRRVVDGLKNAEIAFDLEIAEQTIKDHLSNIYMKTGAENRMALMRNLLQISEISPEGITL
jgi:DNA-binding CsgD family transcriptional regulator